MARSPKRKPTADDVQPTGGHSKSLHSTSKSKTSPNLQQTNLQETGSSMAKAKGHLEDTGGKGKRERIEPGTGRAPSAESAGRSASGSDSVGDFDRVFALWRSTGDTELRERLILMHRPLVAYVARRFMDRGEQFEDIMQQGVIALIHALDQFDPQRGVRFATFATPTIVGELRRYFRDRAGSIRVPRRMQELLPVVNMKIESLTQELNRSPTYVEIARALSLDVEEVAEVLELSHTIDPVSLDDYVPTEAGAALVTVADQIGGPDTALEEWIDYTALKAALEKLPEKQRRVLQLAYFQGYSQMEIARTMKVSQMHISRLQRRALSQLRELMEG